MVQARTGVVVVFYHPDEACIKRTERLSAFGACVVIDNTEGDTSRTAAALSSNVLYWPNGANLGIATALNQGVSILIDAGCEFILLFDQDSDPSAELLEGLPRLLEDESRRGKRVAVVGPAYIDERLGGVTRFVRFAFPALERVPAVGGGLIEADFLITSGSCINAAAWADIGPMDDELFIDFVDLEWCVRARARDYSVLGAPAFRLSHTLGGEPIRIFGRVYPSHGPLRHYYLFRNATNLILRGYMPWRWKWTELVAMPVRLVIYGVWLRPRVRHVWMSLLGIWHGLTGRMGKLQQP
ncbi:dTDP-rhamnosyl transferase RfbF [Candidatus Burkholderia verschuerenii]|uniref:dTDP-rhamnosyl transferase RfbF n=1 Tax=Candidatus Burkholderia verschuerenii TaxID=242163 RepID=A0A0L0MFF5_9BURK|nr:glycosyltransferase family 2 protein [Candidatus Burkholderia verschuerenii]KND60689.1 dTDP-rhamnosyl transferase RfbF [Candidatus Burkholderia verschuerenii]